MRRFLFASLVAALCLGAVTGCSKKEEPKPQQAKKLAIIDVQAAPGSAFKMALVTDPAYPKFASKTKFQLKLTDQQGAPVTGAQLHAKLVMPLMDMGKNEFDLADRGGGSYEGAGEFTMAGEWVVTVTAKQGDKTGKYDFNVMVEE